MGKVGDLFLLPFFTSHPSDAGLQNFYIATMNSLSKSLCLVNTKGASQKSRIPGTRKGAQKGAIPE